MQKKFLSRHGTGYRSVVPLPSNSPNPLFRVKVHQTQTNGQTDKRTDTGNRI